MVGKRRSGERGGGRYIEGRTEVVQDHHQRYLGRWCWGHNLRAWASRVRGVPIGIRVGDEELIVFQALM
jgi:hypothetical protein